jgi:flagellar hook-associated protein 1 FlgK
VPTLGGETRGRRGTGSGILRVAMSLFGILQTSATSLDAATLGLQVTGNNIANSNDPAYLRERLIQSAQVGGRQGNLTLGIGVKVDGIQQVVDKFLDERLRSATSDVASSDAQADAYTKLESALNALGNNNLNSSLTNFFGSLQDVLNQPEDVSVRNIAVQKGTTLTQAIGRLDGQVRALHDTTNDQIAGLATDINDLLGDIAKLNVQIIEAEGGGTSHSDAVGLRDRRADDLSKLAEIADIRAIEQPAGDVTVYSGGDYLVTHGTFRKINVVTDIQNGLKTSQLQIDGINAPLTSGGGRLGGLYTARDNVLGGFLTGLNNISQSLIYEFNKVYSGGQGLSGFSQVTAERAVSSTSSALDAAGLPFTPTNGLFQVQVYDTQTGQRTTTDVRVDLNGLDTDTNLQSLATQLDAINGIGATITADGKLQIASDSSNVKFAFGTDSSGVLAALGINTFFTGSSSADIGISQTVKDDPSKLAFSSGGVGEDSQNGEQLATLITAPLASQGGGSLVDAYDQLTGNVAAGSQSASAAADGFRSFQQSLESQHMAISGVNIDEEAVKMIEYQRAYQASAKVISTVNELLQTLLNM